LYFLENCGGNHTLRQGVKDCTPCLRPHRPQGYDAILERLREEAVRRRAREEEPENRGAAPDPAGRG
jgi:Zn-finger protein